MKIVQCPKCKKYIFQATQCLHCGNTTGFTDLSEGEKTPIHENVADAYARMESLLTNRRFDEALTLSCDVIEWMPHFAGIYWNRLLARNKCTSAAELLEKGFDCEEDADFCNALAFSNGIEHDIYLNIQSMVMQIKKALQDEISNHEYTCKMKTNVLRIKKDMQAEMNTRAKKLFSLWSELEKIERDLYTQEMDCRLLSKEYGEAIEKAASTAASIKEEAYRLEECTEEVLNKYQVKIGSILQQSEQAKAALENMKKQHPWVKHFNELVAKRDEQVGAIGAEISALKSYEAKIQQTLDTIDEIEQRHGKAIRAVEKFDFLDAANLLGRNCYNKILHNIGFGIDVQTAIPDQDWHPNTPFAANATKDVGNFEDAE